MDLTTAVKLVVQDVRASYPELAIVEAVAYNVNVMIPDMVDQDGSELAEALTLVLAKGWGSPEDVTELNLAVVQASSELASESNFRYNA